MSSQQNVSNAMECDGYKTYVISKPNETGYQIERLKNRGMISKTDLRVCVDGRRRRDTASRTE